MGYDRAPRQPLMPPSDPYSGVELRHLRYLVAVAEAGTFTQAAERMFIAQPTLSQQVRRLEQMVGTPLLSRRRDGLRLTAAGRVLLEESRTVLSIFEHGLRRSRQAAGLDRLRLRFVVPPHLPDSLAARTATRLRSVATASDVEVIWLEAPLDVGFSVVCRRQADAALGWLMSDAEVLPDLLDTIELGKFEPELWIPAALSAGDHRVMSLDELASMDVVHGPRGASPGVYDAWLAVLRARRPCFEFIDPPSQHSLAVALAFAATAGRPTAVLSSPLWAAGDNRMGDVPQQVRDAGSMVRVRLDGHPLTATAAMAWSDDLPRHLQQVLFDTADAGVCPLSRSGDG
jgi:DNA-binding transcriptional LysR family regulator